MDYNSFYFNQNNSCFLLIEGDDDLLKNLAIKKLKNQYNIDDLDYLELNEDITLDLIESSLEPVPFFSEKRLIVLNEYYPKTKEQKALASLIEKYNNASSILVFCNRDKNDTLKKLDVDFVDCNKCESFLIKYCLDIFSKEKVKIEKEVISKIIDFCSCEAFKVEAECKKLIGFCLDKKEVTAKDVENIVNKDLDYKIYELTDYIAKKQQQKAYQIINDMLGKGEPEHKLFVTIYNHFKRLFYCKLNSNAVELAEVLGIKEYAVKKAMETANRFTAVTLKDITQRFSEYDYNVKSGKLDIKNALWLSIFKIAL